MNTLTFVKRTSQICELKFKFNREIIKAIKTIPDFMYENKKWFIPTDKFNELFEKVKLLNLINEDSQSAKRSIDCNEDRQSAKKSIDCNDDKTNQKKTKQLQKVFITKNLDSLVINLPVSKYVYAKLINCEGLKIDKNFGKNWLIESTSIDKFYESCKENEIIIDKSLEDTFILDQEIQIMENSSEQISNKEIIIC